MSPLPMRLSAFITANQEAILQEWENFAGTRVPAASGMPRLALRNHAKDVLTAIVADMDRPQSALAQVEKSRGKDAPNTGTMGSAASAHAAARLLDKFSGAQVISEFRALRASVIRLWSEVARSADATDLVDLVRFNEAVDQLLTESVGHYTDKVNVSRDLLLGMIGHELRDPLATISMSATLLAKYVGVDPDYETVVARLTKSVERMGYIVSDLFDLTVIRFGTGMAISPVNCDLAAACRESVDERVALHPGSVISWEKAGDCRGEWDELRLRQVMTNLLGNAIKHGNAEPIRVTTTGTADLVEFAVNNRGRLISDEDRVEIFGPLMRGIGKRPDANGLGLGLYISQAIVAAHGGSIVCTSTEKEGTTFTVSLPRQLSARVPSTVESVEQNATRRA